MFGLKQRCAGVGIHHNAAVHASVLVVGKHPAGLLERNLLIHNFLTDRIEARQGIFLLGVRYGWFQQNVAAVHAFALLLNHLDDMVAVVGFHNF